MAGSSSATEVTSNLKVDTALLLKQPRDALLPLLQQVSGWEMATEANVKVSQLSGAMTNLIYRCRYQCGDQKLFALARVFGNTPEDLFSRDYEQMIFKTVAHAGMGPKLLVSFQNGRIEEFYVTCKCLSAAQLSEPDVSRALAAAMSNFHFTSLLHLPPEEAKDPQVWSRLRGWLKFAIELYGVDGLGQHGLSDATAQIERLEARLRAEHPSWLAFCHNDLQCGNIMLDPTALEQCDFTLSPVGETSPEETQDSKTNEQETAAPLEDEGARGEEPYAGTPSAGQSPRQRSMVLSTSQLSLTASLALHEDDLRDAKGQTLLPRSDSAIWVAAPTTAIKLIDYEYAGINCVAFDIANHWCEFAADYDTVTPHKLDFSKLPTTGRQAEFVDAYVASLARVHASLATSQDDLDIINAKITKAQKAAGVNAERPLPEEASRALALGGGALDDLSTKLQAAARAYIPVSHMAWGLWGLIQAKSSTIDFNYVEYATQRLNEFQRLVSHMSS